MTMKFKAEIEKCWHPKLKDSETQAKFKTPPFTFTKYRIEFPEEFKNDTLHLIFDEVCPFTDNAKYIFGKTVDDYDKKRFTITLENGNGCETYLNINWSNKIICNLIHKRYWWQKESNFLIKEIIKLLLAALLGFLIGLKSCRGESTAKKQSEILYRNNTTTPAQK
jgi:hypothetical protein